MNLSYLTKTNQLRLREVNKERIKSMLKFAETNAKIILNLELNEDSASLIYRELYESIRQLGDATLWLKGYEPLNHDVSMEALKEIDIKNKLLLNHLTRFKTTRHDINYRGVRASIKQAEEIIDFWKKCCLEIAGKLNKELGS